MKTARRQSGCQVSLASRPCASSRRGFTLVELLVVLTIIGLLMAILVPTVFVVIGKAKNTKIALEIANLSQGLEAYRLDAGDYPPNFDDWNVVKRHVLKRWQQIPATELAKFQDFCKGGNKAIDPAEALVFWLGGQSTNGGLKANDVMPLTGTEPKKYFEFDQARFKDVDSDGWAEYAAPGCLDAPYVYFDARSYAAYSVAADQYAPTIDTIARGVAKPAPVANPAGTYANPTTYQILAAGQDGNFGTGGLIYPDGPYTGGDRDNIANYSEGRTLQDSVP